MNTTHHHNKTKTPNPSYVGASKRGDPIREQDVQSKVIIQKLSFASEVMGAK